MDREEDRAENANERGAREAAEIRNAQKVAPAMTAKAERGETGARVRIGTVEIRAVLPREPARPPAVLPVQTPENRMGQSQTRSGGAEPLARGLAWNFGLIQG